MLGGVEAAKQRTTLNQVCAVRDLKFDAGLLVQSCEVAHVILIRTRKHRSKLNVTASYLFSSSTAQGGGGSFKNRKRIGEIGCCE